MRPLKLDYDFWVYKKFNIQEESHPKLQGKYGIYHGETEHFFGRANTLKDAVEIIENYLKEKQK